MCDAELIGCWAHTCKTCREFLTACKGCKPGYLNGTRKLQRARRRMKICCLTRGYATCADCKAFDRCATIQRFLRHPGYKYSKYRQSLEFIRAHGYAPFIQAAASWKGAYGKLE